MLKFFHKLGNKKSKNSSTVISTLSKKPNFLRKELSFSIFDSFPPTERINFFRNLSAMISAGISIVEALEILIEQVKSKKVKKAIQTIADDTKNGQKLADSMAKFPKYFSASIVGTVNMADISGKITETLDHIADNLEKDEEVKKKVQGALAYPAIIISVMIIVIIAFAFYILPIIAKVLQELNAPLPLPTRILLSISTFIRTYPFALPEIIGGIIIFFFLMFKIKKGRYVMHYLMLRIPIFGELIKEYNLILFFRSLQSLFSSGVSIVYAVDVAKETITNDAYKKVLDSIHPTLLHGTPFSNAIAPFPFFFSKQTQKIIWVGEQTGRIENSLDHITNYYERSVSYKTRILTVLIEPILIVLIGIVVGGLALSIFMPLYGLMEVI